MKKNFNISKHLVGVHFSLIVPQMLTWGYISLNCGLNKVQRMYFVAILACVCADGNHLVGRVKLLMQDSER